MITDLFVLSGLFFDNNVLKLTGLSCEIIIHARFSFPQIQYGNTADGSCIIKYCAFIRNMIL